ncbi:MAG: antitoxin VapB family protein [Halobaculum sp.]
MGTKTIGVREEAYERLKARKRDDESFTDLVNRLLDESTTDWRDGFGTLDAESADELERVVERSRAQTGAGLTERQRDALDALSDAEDSDEAA